VQVLGNGLLALSLQPFATSHPGSIALASGVSDSLCTDESQFDRETRMLDEVIEMARSSGRRLVYFSGGGAVYGHWDAPAAEDQPLKPRSAYGRHQLACERRVYSAGIRNLIVRLPNVVGPGGHPHQLIPSLVRQALKGHVTVQMDASRDLVDASDLGPVLVDLLNAVEGDAVVNIATGHSTGAATIVDEICVILGVRPQIVTVDGGEQQRFDTTRLKGLLGYDPFPDPDAFRQSLRRYVPVIAGGL
jgi:nucleoside-diphosphate-sugar epimerase